MKNLCFIFSLISTLTLSAQNYNFSHALEAIHAENYDKALDYLDRDIKDFPKKAASHYYRAYSFNAEQKYAQALTELSNVFNLLTNKEKNIKSDSYNLRAKIYASINNKEKAIDNFNAAIKINPKDSDYYLNRAQLYSDLKQYDKAESDYQKVLTLNEGNLKAWQGIGTVYLLQKKYSDAEKTFTELIKLSPDYSNAYYLLAKVFYAQKKQDKAIDYMFHALLLDETNNSIRSNYIEYAKSNYLLAKANVNAKLTLNPEKFSWVILSAKLSEQNNDFKSAVNDFSKALELSSIDNKNDLLIHRANCYTESGFYKEALADYHEALAADSTLEYCWGYRGYTKQQMGDFEGAVKDFTKAIAINPLESWFYYRRGWVYDEFLKNHNAGLVDYNQAIAIDKDYAYTYLNRGRLYATVLHDTAKANKDYETILLLDTVVNDEGNCRQFALMEIGRKTEAINWLNKIIEKFPTSGNYYDAICLYSKMNKPIEALSSLKMAFEKGYRSLSHISTDNYLDNIRNLPEFNQLIEKWKSILSDEEKSVETVNTDQSDQVQQSAIIPLKFKVDGVYELACKINELPLSFVFDTGACDISISQTEVQFMLKNDYMKPGDILGKQEFSFANGDIEVGTKIILRKVEIGGLILHNVAASVIDNSKAPLLFGQSALSKYGKIVIDNDKKTITISSTAK